MKKILAGFAALAAMAIATPSMAVDLNSDNAEVTLTIQAYATVTAADVNITPAPGLQTSASGNGNVVVATNTQVTLSAGAPVAGSNPDNSTLTVGSYNNSIPNPGSTQSVAYTINSVPTFYITAGAYSWTVTWTVSAP